MDQWFNMVNWHLKVGKKIVNTRKHIINRMLVSVNNRNLLGTRNTNSTSTMNSSITWNGILKKEITMTYIGKARLYWTISPLVSSSHWNMTRKTSMLSLFFFLTDHSDLSQTSKKSLKQIYFRRVNRMRHWQTFLCDMPQQDM